MLYMLILDIKQNHNLKIIIECTCCISCNSSSLAQKFAFSILTYHVLGSKLDYTTLRHRFISFEALHHLRVHSIMNQSVGWEMGCLLLLGDWGSLCWEYAKRLRHHFSFPFRKFLNKAMHLQLLGNLSGGNEKQSVTTNIGQASLRRIMLNWLWWLLKLKCPGSRTCWWGAGIKGFVTALPQLSLLGICFFCGSGPVCLFPWISISLFWLSVLNSTPKCWLDPPATDEHCLFADGVSVTGVLQLVADWVLLSVVSCFHPPVLRLFYFLH